MLEELKKVINREITYTNSEWRVKVVGSQSCMRLGTIWHLQKGRLKRRLELGQEVYEGRFVSSDLSPHWSNITED